MKNLLRLIAITFVFASMAVAWAKDLPIAADFKLLDTKDNSVTLSSYRHSQPVLLFFWTTWCPFCQREIRVLNSTYTELEKNNLKILAIDAGESRKVVISHLREMGLMFSVLLDEDGKVSDAFEVFGVPTYILINRKGEIVFNDNYFPKNYLDLTQETGSPK